MNTLTTPNAALTPPTVSMVKSGTTWTLSVPAVYAEYRWLNMGSINPNSPIGSSSSISNLGNGQYACLVRSGNNWVFSPTVNTSCGTCRVGAAWSEEEVGIKTSAYPIPADQDITIEFTVPARSRVRLELIDMQGRITATLADAIHDQGTFKYPVRKQTLGVGISMYRLTVNDLSITKKLISIK